MDNSSTSCNHTDGNYYHSDQSMLLYIAVAIVAVGAVGAEQLHAATTEKAAPLQIVAQFSTASSLAGCDWCHDGDVGRLADLILGLSRVPLAMARRGDIPSIATNLPTAVVSVAVVVAALAATGSIETTWTFSRVYRPHLLCGHEPCGAPTERQRANLQPGLGVGWAYSLPGFGLRHRTGGMGR